VTIETLPDETLLGIFDFYVDGTRGDDRWHTLVHVCQRWRNVVFASPRRLDLRLLSTQRRSLEKILDLWPALPIIVRDNGPEFTPRGAKNIIAALKYRNRICEMTLSDVSAPFSEQFLAIFQEPFPELTDLTLSNWWNVKVTLPDTFLGGSTPRLQTLCMRGISFPVLPKLLLSASHLVRLGLWDIPNSGYISPEAIATCLSTLNRLEQLDVTFDSPRSRPDRATQRPPPLKRSVLPALTRFGFKGVSEYLEDLVARIDAPRLRTVTITFFNQLIFDVLQLSQFLSRVEAFQVLDQARINLLYTSVDITLSGKTEADHHPNIQLEILCMRLEWQLSSLAQLCDSLLPPFAALERLDIDTRFGQRWEDDMEDTQWLELLRPFSTVKDLRTSNGRDQGAIPSLQELGKEGAKLTLPLPQNVLFWSLQKAIKQFVTARQLSGHPVTVHPKLGHVNAFLQPHGSPYVYGGKREEIREGK